MTISKHEMQPGSTFTTVGLDVVLGTEGMVILKAIKWGLTEPFAIHIFTSIPVPCIEGKLRAMVEMKLLIKDLAGYKVDEENELIQCIPTSRATSRGRNA
jgi:hypothetical protein